MNHPMPKHTSSATRRQFLATLPTLYSLPALSSLIHFNLTNAVLAEQPPTSDYKALVCVFLKGGNDSYNMLIPAEAEEYALYKKVRGNKSLALKDCHSIKDPNSGKSYALHPSLKGLHELYQKKSLSLIANIGTLIQPSTVKDIREHTFVPQGLYSHYEQQVAWQSSIPQRNTRTGWIGRVTDLLNSSQEHFLGNSMSMNGNNLLQTGFQTSPYFHSPTSQRIASKIDPLFMQSHGTLESHYDNILKQQYAYTQSQAHDQIEAYQRLIGQTSLQTPFPSSSLGKQLREVALVMNARRQLNAPRQTFYVSVSGYDTHERLLGQHEKLMRELNDALVAFQNALHEMQLQKNVITYTASEFGRTLTGNTSGTDHGWGGNALVMGDAMKGGQILGEYPENLDEGGQTNLGRGRQLPTTSVDLLHGALAQWYGVPNDRTMEAILPNIRNFWAKGSPSPLQLV